MAAREAWLNQLVSRHTEAHWSVSNAWLSRSSLASVFNPLRCTLGETYWGLVPDVALTQTLRNVVGLDVAKELTFTARIVSGSDAVALRLATHLSDDPHRDATALAREIAERSPDAVRAAKKLFNTALSGSVAEGLLLETELQKAVAGGANQREAVSAHFEKRPPRFRDPA